MSDVHNKLTQKKYVVTYKELIFIFCVFVIILVALYPKDLLKEEIVSEKANYDLSMLYLKNLLQHNPDDESLMLILATQSIQSGNKDLAIRLLELLLKSENAKIRKKALLLSYELNKEQYFYIKEPALQKKAKKKLKKLFYLIYNGNLYADTDLQRWYQEAIFLDATWPAYTLAKQMIEKGNHDIKLIKNTFYTAVKLKKKSDALYLLSLLIKYDAKEHKKWILQKYNLYMSFKDYKNAEQVLVKNAKSEDLKNLLADFYLFTKQYSKAAKIYFSLYRQSVEQEGRDYYFQKAIEALLSAHKVKEAVKILKKNEDKFLFDQQMREFFLKVYMMTERLDDAAKLSEKILKRVYKK